VQGVGGGEHGDAAAGGVGAEARLPGGGRGTGQRQATSQGVDAGGDLPRAHVGSVQHRRLGAARELLVQAVGGIGKSAAEGVDRGVGAAEDQHLGPGGGEGGDQGDAGGGEVL